MRAIAWNSNQRKIGGGETQDGNHKTLDGREVGKACSEVYGVLALSRWVVLNNSKGLESHTFFSNACILTSHPYNWAGSHQPLPPEFASTAH